MLHGDTIRDSTIKKSSSLFSLTLRKKKNGSRPSLLSAQEIFKESEEAKESPTITSSATLAGHSNVEISNLKTMSSTLSVSTQSLVFQESPSSFASKTPDTLNTSIESLNTERSVKRLSEGSTMNKQNSNSEETEKDDDLDAFIHGGKKKERMTFLEFLEQEPPGSIDRKQSAAELPSATVKLPQVDNELKDENFIRTGSFKINITGIFRIYTIVLRGDCLSVYKDENDWVCIKVLTFSDLENGH